MNCYRVLRLETHFVIKNYEIYFLTESFPMSTTRQLHDIYGIFLCMSSINVGHHQTRPNMLFLWKR